MHDFFAFFSRCLLPIVGRHFRQVGAGYDYGKVATGIKNLRSLYIGSERIGLVSSFTVRDRHDGPHANQVLVQRQCRSGYGQEPQRDCGRRAYNKRHPYLPQPRGRSSPRANDWAVAQDASLSRACVRIPGSAEKSLVPRVK